MNYCEALNYCLEESSREVRNKKYLMSSLKAEHWQGYIGASHVAGHNNDIIVFFYDVNGNDLDITNEAKMSENWKKVR